MTRTLFVLTTCLTFLAASAARADDWPAFHAGGGLTGEAKADPGPPPMKTRWTYRTSAEHPAPILGSAAIVGDTVYAADADGTLHAINLASGKARWTYKSEDGFETSPLVANGKVFIGDLAGTFHAVNAADGKRLWTVYTMTTIHASANIAGDQIVFGNDGADIYCLSAADGKVVWKKSAGDRVNGAPAIGFGAALVSGCDAKLRAIDLKTGNEKFAADLGALCPGSPAVLADRIV